MGDFEILNSAIVNVMQNVELDGAPAFADIKTWPTTQFLGLPACSVFESASPSEYSDIRANLRTYSYSVDVFLSYQTEGDGPEVAYATMRKLAFAVLNSLDQSSSLGGACQILRPVPSQWEPVSTDSGICLLARITVDALLLVDQNSG